MDYSMPTVEGIDWEKAHRYLPAKSLLLEVLKEFILSTESQCEKLLQLKEAVLSQNSSDSFAEYRIQAHSMKSALRSLGADLFDLAFELESAGKEEDLSIIEEKTEQFISEYKALSATLQTMVDVKKTTQTYDRETFLTLVDNIKSAMEQFQVRDLQDNIDVLFSIEDIPKQLQPVMEKLQPAARDLDMDAVIDCCNKLEEIG